MVEALGRDGLGVGLVGGVFFEEGFGSELDCLDYSRLVADVVCRAGS